MINLYEQLAENRKEAINILKAIDGKIEFKHEPIVLIINRNNNICDWRVHQVRLNENLEIELLIYKDWISDLDCLSMSANNVYEAIAKQVYN